MRQDKFEFVWVTNRRLSADFFADVRRVAQGGRADKILLRESDLPGREYEILARKTLEIIAECGCGARLIVHSYADTASRLGVRELHLPFDKFVVYANGGFDGDKKLNSTEICEIYGDGWYKFDKNFSDKLFKFGKKIKSKPGFSATKFDGFFADGQNNEHGLVSSPLLKFGKCGAGTAGDKINFSDFLSLKFGPSCGNEAKLKSEQNLTDLSHKIYSGKGKNSSECKTNLSTKFKIGVSVHSLRQALLAQELGADYVVAGHIFDTPSHALERGRGLAFLEQICASLSIKAYAIGGINFKNLSSIKGAGAVGAYMMRGFLG